MYQYCFGLVPNLNSTATFWTNYTVIDVYFKCFTFKRNTHTYTHKHTHTHTYIYPSTGFDDDIEPLL